MTTIKVLIPAGGENNREVRAAHGETIPVPTEAERDEFLRKEAERGMKVFRMNDCDWMAGATLKSCKAEYMRLYVGVDTEEEAFDNPRQLTIDQMNRFKFHSEPDEPNAGQRTFQEELDRLVASGAEFPRFFASTEY